MRRICKTFLPFSPAGQLHVNRNSVKLCNLVAKHPVDGGKMAFGKKSDNAVQRERTLKSNIALMRRHRPDVPFKEILPVW